MTEMQAGRELDAEIARRVFGHGEIVEWSPGYPVYYERVGEKEMRSRALPPYSTDIAAAWQVFIWLTETTGQCVIVADMEEFDADNAVIVRCGFDEDCELSAYWHPAPLGLCILALEYLDRRAALAAVTP